MKCCCFIGTILFMMAANVVYAQQFSFKLYTSAEGLSQNSGYCMAQDGLGYLWMGTQDGLNKFNGKSIVTYYSENTGRGHLPNNFIKTLFYDSLNNWLWIGTASGLCIYNIEADSFYTATHYFAGADTLNGLMVRSVIRGRSATEVLVLTESEGIFICNTSSKSVGHVFNMPAIKNNVTAATVWKNSIIIVANKSLYQFTKNASFLLYSPLLDDVRQLFVWQDNLWVASTKSGALYLTNIEKPVLQFYNSGSKDVGCFAADKAGNLWIGTRTAGIVIVDPAQHAIIQSYTAAPNQNEWPKKFTLSLLKDRQENMWAGSSGGGFALKTNTKKEFGLIQKKEQQYGKAAHNMVLSVYKPPAKQLYAGTQLEGLRIIDMATGNMQTVTNPAVPGNGIYSITASSPKDVWLATLGGMYHFNPATKQFTHFTDSLLPVAVFGQYVQKLQRHDSLLYSNYQGTTFFDIGKRRFTPFVYKEATGKLLNIIVLKIAEDNSGNLWLATNGNGLLKYNLNTRQLTAVDAVARFSKTVNSLYLDDGILWIATASGLVLYNTNDDKITATFSAANGLPGNVLYSIQKDEEGNFWCGSNTGLLKINGYTRAITQVKASAGLQADEFNTACSASDSAGNLYFGGINGITYFNPSTFSIDAFSPQPLIESIKEANKEITLAKSIAYMRRIELTHLQNFITLEFSVNNFINHEECLYRYKLQGVDADWVYPGNRSFVNYSGLQPGTYTFNLQGSNSNGVWSKAVTKLVIYIAPAWWQTIWFMLLCLVVAAVIIYFIIRKRIQDIRYRAETKQKITETEMAALKAQMNPHFMFNCINSIDAFIHSNDKYNATLYLNKFAKMLRNILDSSKQNIVLLSKDVDTLKLYIELEELRHENKFTSTLEVDKELLNSDYKVPPLIIQPFVENAILHGLRNKTTNDGLLQISITRDADKIKYLIQDNGIGRAAAGLIAQNKGSSYGMDMSRERVKLFNKEAIASIEITDLFINQAPAGTKIIVYLNVN